MTYLIHINAQAFAVSDDEIDDVEARILEAVRATGAFIDFVGTGERPLRILVTPASWVWIESFAYVDDLDEGDEGDSDLVMLDLDL
ncbi:hypothetical protein [Salinibacterium xinjiangense]|uniref:hypothetical protein n=1 Tax=Salinibacterium xinjiangense TaxID=386302 RepID=UPI00117A09A4|nr:hypothetical protein [Salinibacterium xinjiangense]